MNLAERSHEVILACQAMYESMIKMDYVGSFKVHWEFHLARRTKYFGRLGLIIEPAGRSS